ncbi:MAG: MMPL family transporter, partial [Planctomycetes bacterium]|nr:MMPL family transporter [Planctomycetota bacterium]
MERWARFISKTAWIWLIAWPIVALAVWVPAPRVQTLLEDDDTGFLPVDMPSRQAFARLKAEFPDRAPASQAAVLFVRDAGLTDEDRTLVDRVARALEARSQALNWHVRAAATAPYLRPLLQSADGCAAVIAVDLPAELLTHSSVNRVREIQRVLKSHVPPPDLEIHVTGSAALGELLDRYAKRDVDLTTVWAFVAVTVILLVIYRSPVAMLLPIVSIAVSLMLALGIVGWAAASWLPVTGLVELLIIVILVGTGVDYCLFLFARFREEMSHGKDVAQATEIALTRSGGAILASAGTNAAGLATLFLADNRDLYTSGPTIAFAICVATFAVLTLTPSLLRLFGGYLFWPAAPGTIDRSDSRIWTAIAATVTRRPVASVLVTLGVLLPAVIVGTTVQPLYDSYEEYPADSSFVRGAMFYQKHFFQGQGVSEQTLILSTDARLDTATALPALRRTLDGIAERLAREFPVLYQRDLQDPLGSSRNRGSSKQVGLLDQLTAGAIGRIARDAYVGKTGKATRIDLGLAVEARSDEAMDQVPGIRAAVLEVVEETGLLNAIGGRQVRVDLSGLTPEYRDMRDLRRRDFRVVAGAAVTVVWLILVWLIRSPLQSLVLVTSTLLT